MDARKYGRSPLEAASFIASSAFPDRRLRGASFLARLSGATAEFLSMWGIMMASAQPFTLTDNSTLVLRLQPALPAWLFKQKDGSNEVSFVFLGSVNVTYHNPLLLDSWTLSPVSYRLTFPPTSAGQVETVVEVVAEQLEGHWAEVVRQREVSSVYIELK